MMQDFDFLYNKVAELERKLEDAETELHTSVSAKVF